jgi:hypothetical protein
MKKGVLIVIVLVGMLSSCSMKTCPTYMYHPDQQKDISVQIDKSINNSVSEVEEAS